MIAVSPGRNDARTLPDVKAITRIGVTARPRRSFFCLLLIFCSAFLVRQDFAAFEKEIQAFEARDRSEPPAKGAVLFIGSSTIRLWTNLDRSFPDLTTIQRGFGGSCLPDSIRYADRIILPYQPSKIVIYAGDNDIARGDSPAVVANHFKEFVQKVHGALPKSRIYFVSIKPSPSRWSLSPQAIEANGLIRDYCAKHKDLKYIDTWKPMLDTRGQPDPTLFRADNLHMNDKGYALWTKIIASALKD
jgi:lysophospholipase L1-like esterase